MWPCGSCFLALSFRPSNPDAAAGKRGEAADFYLTRLDTTASGALEAAAHFRPDLVVAETADFVGPLMAAAAGVPWARHGFGAQLPEPFTAVFDAAAGDYYAKLGFRPTERLAYVDPCPELLQPDNWQPPDDRLPIRPQPYAGDGSAWHPARGTGRTRVLVTFGTMLADEPMLRAILAGLAGLDVDVLVTSRPGDPLPDVAGHVQAVGFVPLARLLEHAAVVVTPGGAGAVLGALSAGLPLVMCPVFPDHRWNGAAVAATGSGIVADTPQAIAPAVQTILGTTAYKQAAALSAARIRQLPDARASLTKLLRLAGSSE